ncbi:MAG: hypothetical protein HYX60_04005 [Legionella longbeachae]|nr:hypothetical protein [Legionella longbeachae]
MNTAIKSIYLITALSLSTIAAYADNTNTSTPADSTSTPENSTSTPASAPSTQSNSTSAPVLTGNYQCQRTDSANVMVPYDLTVTKTGDTYTFEWDDKNGNPAIYGTGVIHPNLNNVLASSFWDPTKPETVGIEMFEIKPDGTLQSNWVLQSQNQLGSETCTKGK